MNDAAFDRRMRQLATRDTDGPDMERLERVLAKLPARGHAAPVPRIPHRRFVPMLAALLLVCATALAAQLGLAHFMERNPYNFYHQGLEQAAPPHAQALAATDVSGLSRLSVTPIDSAWIEGRLTLTFRVSAVGGMPLYMAALTETDECVLAELYDSDDHPSQTAELPCDALLLLSDDVSLRAGKSLDCAPQLSWETQEGDVLLALQCPADFILASELDELIGDDGRIPLRLELFVHDGRETSAEILLLSAAAPTESEKEAMDP